jgi:hypothetical protein
MTEKEKTQCDGSHIVLCVVLKAQWHNLGHMSQPDRDCARRNSRRRSKMIDLIEEHNPRWEDLAEKWGWQMALPRESIKGR